jgi:hypothetical protein
VDALAAIVPGHAQGFPVSGLSGRTGKPIQGEELAEYDRHLAHFFPRPERFEGRTVLLMDVVVDGTTLVQLKPVFERYFQKHGVEVTVETLAVSGSSPAVQHKLSDQHDPLQAGKEAVARYDAHYVGKETLADLRRNPGRRPFARALLSRMARDHELDVFIRNGFRETRRVHEQPQMESVAVSRTDAEPRNRESSKEAVELLRQALVDGDSLSPLVDASGEPVTGRFTIRLEPDHRRRPTLLWKVRSRLPNDLWKPRLTALGERIDHLTRSANGASNPYGLEITLRVDGGRIRDEGAISVKRTEVPVQVGVKRIATAQIQMARRADNAPASELRAELVRLQSHLAEAFSEHVFQDAETGRPSRTVTMELIPQRSIYGEHHFVVYSDIPEEAGWGPALFSVKDAIDRATLSADVPGGRRPVRITIHPDEQGRVTQPGQVAVEVAPPKVLLHAELRNYGRVPLPAADEATAPADPRGLAAALAEMLSRTQVRNTNGAPAPRSIQIRLTALRKQGDRENLAVESRLPGWAYDRVLREHRHTIEQLTRPESGAARRNLEIELQLDRHGRVHGPNSIRITPQP